VARRQEGDRAEEPGAAAGEGNGEESDVRLLARVLALRFVRAWAFREKVVFLKGAGFSVREIALMLNAGAPTIRAELHHSRKKKKRT
jgi:hypothetical protein